MKKLIVALALVTLTSNLAHSEEAGKESMAAPTEFVMSLLSQCKEYAITNEVSETDKRKFLLTCINDDFAESDYKSIKVVPKKD